MNHRLLPILVLAACADPLSNQRFYEDSVFVAAFPSEERLGPPPSFLTAPDEGATDLTDALLAAATLDEAFRSLIISGQALGDAQPDVRSAAFRQWDEVPVVAANGVSWWARSSISQPPAAAMHWEIEVAADRIGPWYVLAVGVHEASDNGVLSVSPMLTEAFEGPVVAQYWTTETGERELIATEDEGFIGARYPRYWQFIGDSSLIWTDAVDPIDEGLEAAARVAVHGVTGGRAEAWSAPDGENLSRWSGSCWDATGAEVWRGGDASVPETGDAALCAAEPLWPEPPF